MNTMNLKCIMEVFSGCFCSPSECPLYNVSAPIPPQQPGNDPHLENKTYSALCPAVLKTDWSSMIFQKLKNVGLHSLELKGIFWLLVTLLVIYHLAHMGKMRIFLTGRSGAPMERFKQRIEQVLLGKAWLLLHHRQHCPGGHTLKLSGCQLVFEVQKFKYLKNSRNIRNRLYIIKLLCSPNHQGSHNIQFNFT